jgi:glycosyltransferase involved in cell wall biosynthesis
MAGADAFVMASTNECLGNSIAEAVFAGLPVITHSHAASRFIFGEESEWIIDIKERGSLRNRILALRGDHGAKSRVLHCQRRVSEIFGASSLAPKFYDMLVQLRHGKVSST